MPTMNVGEVNGYIGAITASGDRIAKAAQFIAGDKMGLDGLTSADPKVAETLRGTNTSLINRYHRLGGEMKVQSGRTHELAVGLTEYRNRVVAATHNGTQGLLGFTDEQSAAAVRGTGLLETATKQQGRMQSPPPWSPRTTTGNPANLNIDYANAPAWVRDNPDGFAQFANQWYSRLGGTLGDANSNVKIRFSESTPNGVPAYVSGNELVLRPSAINNEGEGRGVLVHELTHVAQGNYKDTPTWVTEGIADHARYYGYEPGQKTSQITQWVAAGNYDTGYAPTAFLIEYVRAHYDPNIVNTLNDAARAGSYNDAIWTQVTGKSLDQLWLESKRASIN